MSIRVMIADDHAVVRSGIRALFATERDLEVVGEARDGLEAVMMAEKCEPDVILMDLMMPGLNGLDAIRRIIAKKPEARILVLSSFSTDDRVVAALDAGASGYQLKDASLEDLMEAIRRVNEGESSLHPSIARKFLRGLDRSQRNTPMHDQLTERESDVLRLIARGRSNKEIADRLFIGEATVRTHVSNILSKLRVESRTQAALYALRGGMVPLDEADVL